MGQMALPENEIRSRPTLVARRRARNLSRFDAARAMGVHPRTLAAVEDTGVEPRIDAARRIAQFYDTTVEELWPTEDAA